MNTITQSQHTGHSITRSNYFLWPKMWPHGKHLKINFA